MLDVRNGGLILLEQIDRPVDETALSTVFIDDLESGEIC